MQPNIGILKNRDFYISILQKYRYFYFNIPLLIKSTFVIQMIRYVQHEILIWFIFHETLD